MTFLPLSSSRGPSLTSRPAPSSTRRMIALSTIPSWIIYTGSHMCDSYSNGGKTTNSRPQIRERRCTTAASRSLLIILLALLASFALTATASSHGMSTRSTSAKFASTSGSTVENDCMAIHIPKTATQRDMAKVRGEPVTARYCRMPATTMFYHGTTNPFTEFKVMATDSSPVVLYNADVCI